MGEEQGSESGPPLKLPSVLTPTGDGTGHARIVAEEFKDDLKTVKERQWSTFLYVISAFAAGFIILAGFMIGGYFRLDDKLTSVSDKLIRIDTKLEDLLARTPPQRR